MYIYYIIFVILLCAIIPYNLIHFTMVINYKNISDKRTISLSTLLCKTYFLKVIIPSWKPML